MAKRAKLSKTNLNERLFDIFNYTLMILVIVITLYPFLNVLALSLNESTDTVRGGIYIWPREFTLDNYAVILQYDTLITGFTNSVLRTVIGTVLGVFVCSMIAYTLSRKDFQARKFVSTVIVLTMFFSGGLIPTYMLIRDLGLINSFAVYILPGLVSAWNIIIIRSFMDGLPFALQESAKIDGANDFTIYWKIILPICKPVLATIALFIAVSQWNAWFDTYIYNSTNPALTTLQYELMKILQNTTTSTSGGIDSVRGQGLELMKRVSPESVRMAITIVTVVPILLVYPFLQRYFVKGMTLGAVK
ncbi:putative aldouronate transport system permease protein [Evansella caseinilytica]|uniref:Putative aldouronate transport system permease protein n=1 Tax=Evansella caseinilytica TaxID=1503961 RepID=A0A1H3QZZ8_9BACI|nr:carbohydrate ABC transporter permease [Evansella caseinilytica]SDZ18997.1 putative aldouronate transport system permease protein [Evansella caseinilytica]